MIDNRTRTSETTRGTYTVSKLRELWPTNGFKWDLHFYTPSVNSACVFRCQASHTEVSKRNSTKLCDLLGSEQDLQMHVKNLNGYRSLAGPST